MEPIRELVKCARAVDAADLERRPGVPLDSKPTLSVPHVHDVSEHLSLLIIFDRRAEVRLG